MSQETSQVSPKPSAKSPSCGGATSRKQSNIVTEMPVEVIIEPVERPEIRIIDHEPEVLKIEPSVQHTEQKVVKKEVVEQPP